MKKFVYGLAGFFFTFFSVTGRELALRGNILWTPLFTLGTVGGSLLCGAAFGAAADLLPKRWSAFWQRRSAGRGKAAVSFLSARVSGTGAGKVFGVSFALTALCWLPVWLACYPAVCAYDFPVQINQIVTGQYIDHHPLVHTLLIGGAIKAGEWLWGSANDGIGALALLQMLLLAAAFGTGVAFLWKRRTRALLLFLLQIYCMFFPFHWYMSVSMTKDTLFAVFFLLQTLALGRMAWEGVPGKMTAGLFFVSSVGTILFRNNGKYAFLVLLAFLLAGMALKKERRSFYGKLFLLAAAAFIAGNVILRTVFLCTGAEQGDRREMLSIPIQQMARTMLYHGGVGVLPEDDNSMEDTDKALINDFILQEGYKNYRADLADPVKGYTNTYVVRYRAKEFLSSYCGLLIRYPGEFINAFLAVNAGYLYPGDVSHAYINTRDGESVGKGYAQTGWYEQTVGGQTICQASKLEPLFEKLESWASENAYLRMPVLKWLFVPGTYLYLYLLWLGALLSRKAGRAALPAVMPFGYFLTLLLGPAVQLRYLYPIMIVYPFWVLMGRNNPANL